ncbi:LCP family protein [Paenibacillus sediminis]|uniref:LCP family protein required for cell wall assembly n=1 Tax=Paenibacillus sediminis TaxID=664909 RepID=A0ABS4H5L7_9BACL|nr:LCP family protein [Paenibacillus sediminis]MBP1937375.1 LCP family protein required for cell wall assembly [Paenibacillus sediminis]
MKYWKRITILTLSVVIIGIWGYGFYLYQSVKSTANHIYEARKPTEIVVSIQEQKGTKLNQQGIKQETKRIDLKKRDPFTVLLMGVDERQGDRGRSDTLIVLAVNPEKGSILMFNIPRDTRTEITGHGTIDKINHAYAFGGVEMALDTVEHFLNYPINYYIKVNMEGFANMIDLIGGVQVDNAYTFKYEGYIFNKGELKLHGNEALAYSRMRYDDPRGDIGRNSRQREIIKQLLNNALQMNNMTQVDALLKQIRASVKTNISFDDMKTFLMDYRSDLKKLDTAEIQGNGRTIDGIWYYIVKDEERERIHELLNNQL